MGAYLIYLYSTSNVSLTPSIHFPSSTDLEKEVSFSISKAHVSPYAWNPIPMVLLQALIPPSCPLVSGIQLLTMAAPIHSTTVHDSCLLRVKKSNLQHPRSWSIHYPFNNFPSPSQGKWFTENLGGIWNLWGSWWGGMDSDSEGAYTPARYHPIRFGWTSAPWLLLLIPTPSSDCCVRLMKLFVVSSGDTVFSLVIPLLSVTSRNLLMAVFTTAWQSFFKCYITIKSDKVFVCWSPTFSLNLTLQFLLPSFNKTSLTKIWLRNSYLQNIDLLQCHSISLLWIVYYCRLEITNWHPMDQIKIAVDFP